MLPIVAAFVVVGVIAYFIIYNSEDAKALREMKRAPLVRAADGKTGQLVRVVGKVRIDEPLVSPLSGKPCAYFRLVVKYAKRTNIFVELRGVRDFAIEDESGRVWIVATNADATTTHQRSRVWGPLRGPDLMERRVEILRENGQEAMVSDVARLSFIEGVFEVGETVTAYGILDEEVDAAPGEGYRAESKRLVMRQVMGLSDEPSVAS